MAKPNSKSQIHQWTKLLLGFLRSPILIGLLLTAGLVAASLEFYHFRSWNEQQRKGKNLAFEVVDWANLRSLDMRFQLRGPKPIQASTALIAIDDRSIEEVGRWPWSRAKMAQVIDELFRHEAAALGLDIVFSEPEVVAGKKPLQEVYTLLQSPKVKVPSQVNGVLATELARPEPDDLLTKTLAQHKERIVLGTFSLRNLEGYQAFQDFCRNESFRRANADQFVKLNVSFIVADLADPFDGLDFGPVFDQIFGHLEEESRKNLLESSFGGRGFDQLSEIEQRKVQFEVANRRDSYCHLWLTDEDPYLEAAKDAYQKIFSQSPLLADRNFEDAIAVLRAKTLPSPIRQSEAWTINLPKFQEATEFTGSFNAKQDSDGTIRRLSLFQRTGNRIGTSYIPSLALQTFLLASGLQARIEIDVDPSLPSQKKLTRFGLYDMRGEEEKLTHEVPVDGQGQLLINYYGGPNQHPYLSIRELLDAKDTLNITQNVWDPERKLWITQEKVVNRKEFIKGRSFLMGATALGIYDLRVTPFEKNYPGPETHLTAMSNLFEGSFLRVLVQEEKWMPWILGGLGVIMTLVISMLGSVMGLLATLVVIASVIGIDDYLFSHGIVATTVLPVFLCGSMYLVLTFYKYFTEERKKRYLRSTFSKYVSPAIVDEILKDPGNVELGGRKERLTVFFSDVRGFTTISEKLDPTQLSEVLNRYLTPMTQIIFANKGTLDKYIGDAVMAFFGAPVAFSDHPEHAARAALQSLEKLKELQTEFRRENLPEIDIGIGLNTWEVSVGNMGSDIVRNYTVMGDGVNLASRLEGITKEYGVRIVISEFTQTEIAQKFTTRELDRVRVKGKDQPVRIFELINEGTPQADWVENLTHYQAGFNAYHERRFSDALRHFEFAQKARVQDPVSALYLKRCQEYLKEPPPPEWDGVYVMKTK